MMNTSNRIILSAVLVTCTALYSTAGLAGGCSGSSGKVIFDMTANPGDLAVDVNLNLQDPCGSKGDTAITSGYGNNAINISDFQVLWRDVFEDPNELMLSIGASDSTVVEDQFGSNTQNNQFAAGGHLFDLDRLRAIADWMSSGNAAISTDLPDGTYGTISYSQFLENISNNTTMYGMVRVLVPLELGNGRGGRNALGSLVDEPTIYGLCKSGEGLCSCPTKDIKEGETLCGHHIPSGLGAPDNRKIKIRGSLMWDFVAAQDSDVTGLSQGDPIPLENLPWAPRKLYFKVIIPIQVNWEHDLDDDGAMDNMFYIRDVSFNKEHGSVIEDKLDYSYVPDSSKSDYFYYTGKELTEDEFDKLDIPTQYHLMMAGGYASSWEEAFEKLGITAEEWGSIPGISPPMGLPRGATGKITTNDVRNPMFEDIPAYMYTGGLIDMHSHVNIAGLVYVPQGMELEAKNSFSVASLKPTRQYVIGAVIVRDTFYIEAKDTTITLISSDPTSYSAALLSETAARYSSKVDMAFGRSVAGGTHVIGSDGEEDEQEVKGVGADDDFTLCYTGCSPGGGKSAHDPGETRWIEVRPENN
jgi:hypothetical protein